MTTFEEILEGYEYIEYSFLAAHYLMAHGDLKDFPFFEKYDVPYLHRKKVPGMKNGRKTQVYVYWYDESFSHEITYTGKVYREKMEKKAQMKELLERAKNAPRSEAEARAQMANDPDFINIDGKFIRKMWMINNPEKAKSLYGMWFRIHPDVYAELYGEN